MHNMTRRTIHRLFCQSSEIIMDNRDPSSDAERSDPEVADANRDKLKKDADAQMKKIRRDLRKGDGDDPND